MNMLATIHWLDVAIFVILGFGALVGARRGVLRQTFRLVTYAVSFYVALQVHPPVADFLQTHLQEAAPTIPRLHSFLGTFFVLYLILFVLTRVARKGFNALCLDKAERLEGNPVQALGLRPLDGLLGAGMGVMAATLLVAGALLGLSLYADTEIETSMAGSRLRPQLFKGMQTILAALPQEYKDDLGLVLDRAQEAGWTLAGELTRNGIHDTSEKVKMGTSLLEEAKKAAASLGINGKATGKDRDTADVLVDAQIPPDEGRSQPRAYRVFWRSNSADPWQLYADLDSQEEANNTLRQLQQDGFQGSIR